MFPKFLIISEILWSYVASAGTLEELADFFKKICSNRKVANATLYISYSSAFKILAETEKEQMGSRHQKVRTYFKGLTP